MARYSAFLDACVLVPIALADTLLRLAEAGLYRPLWSNQVLDEVVDAIGMIHPALAFGPARSRADAMQASFEDACVTDWEELVAGVNHSLWDGREYWQVRVVPQPRRRRNDPVRSDLVVDHPRCGRCRVSWRRELGSCADRVDRAGLRARR